MMWDVRAPGLMSFRTLGCSLGSKGKEEIRHFLLGGGEVKWQPCHGPEEGVKSVKEQV